MASSRLGRFRTRQQIERSKQEERLYFAIQDGDSDRLRSLIENGCNPDHEFEGPNLLNKRLLHLACEKGKADCAEVLLTSGANPNPRDAWWQTPLMNAVCTERENMVRLMLQHPVDMNMTDNDTQGKNPLYHAIMKDGRADVIATLIRNNCNVNNRDLCEKRMPLAAAIMNAGEDIVTYVTILLDAGANPNALDHFGFTPMTSLIKRGFRDGSVVSDKHMQIAELLMYHGHDLNLTMEAKYWFQYTGTALKMAAERKCPKLINFLLKRGADPDIADDKGVTPLHVAAHKGCIDAAKLLIAANAKLNIVCEVKLHRDDWDPTHLTPIKYALLSSSAPIAHLLLAAGCNVTHDDYLWCEQNASNLLQTTTPSVGDTGDFPRTDDGNVQATAQPGAIGQFQMQAPQNRMTRSHFSPGNIPVMYAPGSYPLMHSQSVPTLSAQLSDIRQQVLSAQRTAQSLDPTHDMTPPSTSAEPTLYTPPPTPPQNELQVALSLAASQPRSLFLQSLMLVRNSLGQPFRYHAERLLDNANLEDIVPRYRLKDWLYMSHLTGDVEGIL